MRHQPDVGLDVPILWNGHRVRAFVPARLTDRNLELSPPTVRRTAAADAQAVESAHDRPLSVELVCTWHRTLTVGSPTPARYVGVVRAEQGWIGGSSPLDAALVTPPPE